MAERAQRPAQNYVDSLGWSFSAEEVTTLQTCMNVLGFGPVDVTGLVTPTLDKALTQYLRKAFGPSWTRVPMPRRFQRLIDHCREGVFQLEERGRPIPGQK
jgi:hypothetical protein